MSTQAQELAKKTARSVGGLLVLAGAICLTAQFSWVTLGALAETRNPGYSLLVAAVILAVVGAAIGFYGLTGYGSERPTDDTQAGKWDKLQFGRHLVGLGYCVLTWAVMNGVAIAGYAHAGVLNHIFPVTPKPGEAQAAPGDIAGAIPAAQMLTGIHMALMGALTYFTLALQNKVDSNKPFDTSRFWGGLWLRLGQAIVYSLVAFLFLRFQGSENSVRWLPIIGVSIGLNIRGAEALVSGLVARIFKAIEALAK